MPGGGASVATYQKKEPSGAPFPAGAANNGLSVGAVSGKIVLGNDQGTGAGGSARLLDNREISTNGFQIQLQEFGAGLINLISSDQVTLQATGPGNTAALTALAITFSNPLGNSFMQPDRIDLRESGNIATLFAVAELDLYGSTGAGAPAPQIQFLDNNGFINYIGQVGDELMITINGQPGVGQRVLSINRTTQVYQFGDIDNFGSGTKIVLDDFNQIMNLDSVGINVNGTPGFTGTVPVVHSITVENGIVTAVT